ncbi:GIP [Symbiodinium necroappetens]|uniref:GIP protein n=1 Tax=Symbiodinium necroappetens TaxID=1628268 RepID=A0A813A4G1_9DINO|nr:GIP [Symbiodinium necroappetens]
MDAQQVQQLQQTITAMQQELLTLRAQQQQTEQQQSGVATLAASVAELAKALREKDDKTNTPKILFDTKALGRPEKFTNSEDEFRRWSRSVTNMVVSVFGRSFEEVLEWVIEQETDVGNGDVDLQFGHFTAMSPDGVEQATTETPGVEDIAEKGDQLWRLLQHLCTGESEGIVVNATGGYEAWRRLHRRFDPLSAGRKRNLLRAILNPVRVKGWENVRLAMDQLDDLIRRYEARENDSGHREKLSDDLKSTALELLVPTDLEQHLILNKKRLSTYDAMKQEIQQLVEVKTKGAVDQPGGKSAAALDEQTAEPAQEDELGAVELCVVDSVPIDMGTWLKFNYDTGAARTAIPESWENRAKPVSGPNLTFKTASGELINSKGFMGIIQEDGGHLGPRASPLGKKIQQLIERSSPDDMKGAIPLYQEGGVYNFYLEDVGSVDLESLVKHDNKMDPAKGWKAMNQQLQRSRNTKCWDTSSIVNGVDSKTQAIAATFVEAKGTDPYAIKFWQGFVKHLGYKRFIAKSDGEASIKAMKAKAIEGLKGIEAIAQESPEEDHQANGLAEVAVREVKRQVRVLKSSLEEKLGLTLKDDDPILAWLPRHGADLLSRYRKGEDGRTPEQRRSGKAWRRPALEFGERLYYREAGAKGANKSTLQMKMLEGRYIGHHGGTGSLLVITTEGVKRALGVRRLTLEERWQPQGGLHRLNAEGPLPLQGPKPRDAAVELPPAAAAGEPEAPGTPGAGRLAEERPSELEKKVSTDELARRSYYREDDHPPEHSELDPRSAEDVEDLVRDPPPKAVDPMDVQYRAQQVDVSELEVVNIAALCTEMAAVDVTGAWDLSQKQDVEELEKLIETEEPYLLTGGPPCEAFSRLQDINMPKVTPEVRRMRREKGERHLHACIRMYHKQIDAGRHFLHEHPWSADSWYDPEVKALSSREGVYLVKGPACKWEMQAEELQGLQGKGYVRKETGWLTNSAVLAERLAEPCGNETGGLWHRYVHLVGGIARGAAVYPPKLVKAVLQGLKEQMAQDGHLSSVDAYAAGPVPEEPSMPAGDWHQYWDDVNGGYLDPAGVEEARETGKQPIPLKWVDTQKGDAQNPNLRSRLVVKDIKARKSPEDQLDPAMLFSAMPPLEAVRLLASMLVTKGRSKPKHGRLLRLGSWDISRAHFYGSPKRNIYVKLPPEEGASDDECGLLCKSMYGTQDAPSIWQTHYTQILTEAGWKRGRSNGAVFFHPLLDARVLVHGDDFLCLGDDAAQEALDRTLRDAYELKRTRTIGIEVEGSKRISFLNRVIRLETIGGRHCAVVEADSRHAELLIEELGLKNGKGVETADVKKSVDQQLLEAKAAALPPDMVKKYRSLVMRAAYLSQDRADLGQTGANLKRLGRYLKQYPYAKLVYEAQKEPDKLRVQVDADHAGDAVTRRSTTGMIAFYGRHPIKHASNVQSTIALSTGESEYYALVKAGSTGLGIQSLLTDWGCELGVTLETDSNAAKGQGSRIGLGKARHVQTKYLWLQERVANDHLRIHKVPGECNTSDILTKSVGGPTLRKHLKVLGYRLTSTKDVGHKELLY